MNPFEQLLANILNPGGRNALARTAIMPTESNALPANLQPNALAALSAPQPAPVPAPVPPQGAPVSAVPAPAGMDMPPAAQGAPAPPQAVPQPPQQAPRGGGIGGFLSGLFNPSAAGRNQTIQWLQSQGLDEGTATLLASNKSALQQYLLQRTRGNDPKTMLELEKLALEVEEKRRPTTDDIREYQFARQQGYEGSFADFMKEMRRAGAQNITVGGQQDPLWGDAPKDHVWLRDENGNVVTEPDPSGRGVRPVSVPIAGSAADQELRGQAEAAEGKEEQAKTWNTIVNQDINRAIEIVENSTLPTTGIVGDLLSGIGGTEARNLRGLLDTIKANAGFDRLQAMRDASPTGGALGQVSERELAFLQSTIGNLEQSQTKDQILYNLRRVQKIYQNMLNGKRAYDGLLEEGGKAKKGDRVGGTPEFANADDVTKAFREGRIKPGDIVIVNGQHMRVEVQ